MKKIICIAILLILFSGCNANNVNYINLDQDFENFEFYENTESNKFDLKEIDLQLINEERYMGFHSVNDELQLVKEVYNENDDDYYFEYYNMDKFLNIKRDNELNIEGFPEYIKLDDCLLTRTFDFKGEFECSYEVNVEKNGLNIYSKSGRNFQELQLPRFSMMDENNIFWLEENIVSTNEYEYKFMHYDGENVEVLKEKNGDAVDYYLDEDTEYIRAQKLYENGNTVAFRSEVGPLGNLSIINYYHDGELHELRFENHYVDNLIVIGNYIIYSEHNEPSSFDWADNKISYIYDVVNEKNYRLNDIHSHRLPESIKDSMVIFQDSDDNWNDYIFEMIDNRLVSTKIAENKPENPPTHYSAINDDIVLINRDEHSMILYIVK
jgi:hypothetical protein